MTTKNRAARPKRIPFPSPRQRRAVGLDAPTYPPYLRDLLDYDYTDSLSEDERIWLAAFSEEYYRGWRLKGETQIQNLDQIRASGRDRFRLASHEEPLAFAAHRGPSLDDPTAAPRGHDGPHLTLLSGGSSGDGSPRRTLNPTEDDMVRRIDRKRRPR